MKIVVVWVTCAFCGGIGADPRYGAASRCPVCGVNGMVKVQGQAMSCQSCSGLGRIESDLPCNVCGGVGVVSDPSGSERLAADRLEEVG